MVHSAKQTDATTAPPPPPPPIVNNGGENAANVIPSPTQIDQHQPIARLLGPAEAAAVGGGSGGGGGGAGRRGGRIFRRIRA